MGLGYQKLWGWFSLSYASFLTLPRIAWRRFLRNA